MDRKELIKLLAGMDTQEIAKAMNDAKGFEGIRVVKELWDEWDLNTVPDVSTTKTGPTMHSSGSGADKAMHEYSNPAPQIGGVQAYKEFTEKNIEGWGKMHESFKALNDEVKAGFGTLAAILTQKSETVAAPVAVKAEDKEEKDEHEKDMKDMKGCSKSDIVALYEQLAQLDVATAKAESAVNADKLAEVYALIEKAEKYIEKAEKEEKEEDMHKAQYQINMGWHNLAKSTGLSAHDLHGYGNQTDAQVPGDETKDADAADWKEANAKAKYWASKAERMNKAHAPAAPVAPAVKAEDKEEKKEMKEEKKEEMKAEVKSEDIEALKSQLNELSSKLDAKDAEFLKAVNQRVSEMNARIEQVSGHKMPSMTPTLFKSKGITSDALKKDFDAKIELAVDNGQLLEDEAVIARSIADRYRAVGAGHIAVNKVNQQLDLAPMNVQQFFKTLEPASTI